MTGQSITRSAGLGILIALMTTSASAILAEDLVVRTIAGGGPNHQAARGANIRLPTGLALGSDGSLFVSAAGQDRVFRIDPAGQLTVHAGMGYEGVEGADGPAVAAYISNPRGLATDSTGNLYIAEVSNHRVTRVDAATGNLTIVAGIGAVGVPAGDLVIRSPTDVAFDAAGNLYIADTDHYRIRVVDRLTGTISTFAGNGHPGPGADNVPATESTLTLPTGIAFDSGGNLIIADSTAIRRVDSQTGIITIIAGSFRGGFAGDGGPAIGALFRGASEVALDAGDNVFIADTGNNRVRRIDADDGTIHTVAGNGSRGYSGDGGQATVAMLSRLEGIAVDGAGNLYIADGENHRVRRVDAASGTIDTVAGNGLELYSGDGGHALDAAMRPVDALFDIDGNLLISDANRVRRVERRTGVITTIVGTGEPGFSGDDGPADQATLRSAHSLALDDAGNLFVTDRGNNRIRRVDAVTHVITTVAGNGGFGFSGDGIPAVDASLWGPNSIALDGDANLFIADSANSRIRRVDSRTGIITTVAGNGVYGDGGDGGPATEAQIQIPAAVLVDRAGNIFISDSAAERVRKVDAATGKISNFAGGGNSNSPLEGVPATETPLSSPAGLSLDEDGNLLICESGSRLVRKVDAITGIISWVAGAPYDTFFKPTFLGDGGPPKEARFLSPRSARALPGGALLITDLGNNRVRLVATSNSPPIANAGEPESFECIGNGGAVVALDGSGSIDPDGIEDIVLFEWFLNFGSPDQALLGEGEQALVPLPLGVHRITLRVTDSAGVSDASSVEMTVVDTVAPELSLSLEPEVLWPPNHRMVDISAQVMASDECVTPTITLSAVSSSEVDNEPGRGDGDTAPDIDGAGMGASDFEFALRAERDGAGAGRVYSVEYVASDGSGNQARASAEVFVPHDQRGQVEPVVVAATQEPAGTLLTWTAAPDAETYDVIRGELRQLADRGDAVELGVVSCIESRSVDETTAGYADVEMPAAGRAFFYLVGYHGAQFSSFGSESTGKPRIVGSGGCTNQAGSRNPAVNPAIVQLSRD